MFVIVHFFLAEFAGTDLEFASRFWRATAQRGGELRGHSWLIRPGEFICSLRCSLSWNLSVKPLCVFSMDLCFPSRGTLLIRY